MNYLNAEYISKSFGETTLFENISFSIHKGQKIAFIAKNGAGKTTLISQLTGLYPATSGNAWIGGYSIRSQLEIVQTQIGFCPQFDVLWKNLTVEEHLYFYARIKGVAPDEEDECVNKALKAV